VRCKRCGNAIDELFVVYRGKKICRKCLGYKRSRLESKKLCGNGEYKLGYSLTKEQYLASEFILHEIKNKRDCVLSAITGAGKTEIIYPLLKYCVNNKLKVGIVIPRKDVVIELFNRIKKDFINADVIGVYGGNTSSLIGDIIVLTSHQLYRYTNYFDVVIIDEIDAFPFYKNDLLNRFLISSKRGNIVYMSATIPKEILKRGHNVYYLNKRYHGEKLDVPKIKYFWNMFTIKRYVKNHSNSVIIIYFPTIKQQLIFSKKLKIKHYVINSKVHNREELLNKFHKLDNGVILSTLVLERGITFKNTNVIVYLADHKLFSFENLVQISGRVGRHYLYPHGDIIYLVNFKNSKIRKAIRFIKKCNE